MKKQTDIRGSYPGSLHALSPILKNWQRINENWDDSDDVPWWYNERSSLGVLAGAVWQYKGGWAFEEFSTLKRKNQKANSKYPGRCDMTFGFGRKAFWCEAKQCWPGLSGNCGSSVQMVYKFLNQANGEVRGGIEEDYQGLAMVFITPSVKANTVNEQEIDSRIKNFISQLKQIENITLAWTFPKKKRHLSLPVGEANTMYYFPGVIMALQPVP
jgi:hypothetical protein